jgi:dienelactone hydrolase
MKSIWIRKAMFLALCLFAAGGAHAMIKTETIEYRQGDTVLEGYLAYPEGGDTARRPAVMVIHDWTGVGPYARMRVEKLAEMGYVAFAADIYGKGIRPTTPEECGKQAGIYRADRGLMRARANAGLDVLRGMQRVDPSKIAVIGYCFGGGTALELARSGAPVAGTVSFHGNLDTPNPEDARRIKGKVLVCHGADDPYVPAEQVAAFMKEMRDAKVDWQFIAYGGAVHSFTRPDSGDDPSRGAAYNADADRRSWSAMSAFFNEIFK